MSDTDRLSASSTLEIAKELARIGVPLGAIREQVLRLEPGARAGLIAWIMQCTRNAVPTRWQADRKYRHRPVKDDLEAVPWAPPQTNVEMVSYQELSMAVMDEISGLRYDQLIRVAQIVFPGIKITKRFDHQAGFAYVEWPDE